MTRSIAQVGLIVLVSGCMSPAIVSRQRRAPRMATLPGTRVAVASYTSGVDEVPAGCPLLVKARQELQADLERSELFERVVAGPAAQTQPVACTLRPKLLASRIQSDTGFWRNVFACLSVAGMFMDLKLNEVVTYNDFEVDVVRQTDKETRLVKTLRFEMETVYRYPATTALAGTDWIDVQNHMLLVANRNMTASLVHALPPLLKMSLGEPAAAQPRAPRPALPQSVIDSLHTPAP